jgi:hypothetical protein
MNQRNTSLLVSFFVVLRSEMQFVPQLILLTVREDSVYGGIGSSETICMPRAAHEMVTYGIRTCYALY